ncbi:hypothetical protein SOCE26_043500 [Sorangium cellulosum]|uniref:Autotransporter domain-containing protein n=1 Tax=Sorangium cellulosum TaxID=56 RepID=A0A2L0EUF8_SORCE|nr:hypothetical protein [Sorangium cellulosum]AUX42912.1 hypothetical protein SOCE26_043500 [Sorangium cellulosum]
MFSFVLPMLDSDVTARAAVEQSMASSVGGAGAGALMAGVEGAVEGALRGAMSRYDFRLDGSYERVLQVSPGPVGSAPSDSVSARLGGGAGWTLSRSADLSLATAGYLATRLGVRAADALAARDPFLSGNRLQYTLSGAPALAIAASRRAAVHVGVGYDQAGALSADDPEAAGVDAHTGRADASASVEIGPREALTPELRYEVTQLYHAVLDTELTRGPAQVHTGSALLAASRDLTRNVSTRVAGGLTVASPPPVLSSRHAVIAPAARVGLTWLAERYRLTADYTYAYTSLGPRIGFGHEHEASIEASLRPLRGGAHRDLLVTGVVRLSTGSAPVAANPPLQPSPGAPAPPGEGSLSTTTALAGAQIEVPLSRGVALRGGLDLEYVRAALDPAPAAGQPGGSLRAILTAGLSGTLSTDPHHTLRRDPE